MKNYKLYEYNRQILRNLLITRILQGFIISKYFKALTDSHEIPYDTFPNLVEEYVQKIQICLISGK